MSTGHFRLPEKKAAKSKALTAVCMILIIASLYLTCYMLFFRSVVVDVTKDVSIVYDGESKSATVKVMNTKENYNQRIQEFMDSVKYKVSPAKNLSNGDTITISTTYNEKLAQRYHIEPINMKRTLEVEHLPERIQSIHELSAEFLKTLDTKGAAYLKKNMKMILNDDFTDFFIKSDPALQSTTQLYRIFLDSENNSQKDKIVDIYAITAKGEVNTSRKEEVLELKESTIYYMITYNEINTSLMVGDENVYGEKLIAGTQASVENEEKFKALMKKKYGKQYEIKFLEISATNES